MSEIFHSKNNIYITETWFKLCNKKIIKLNKTTTKSENYQ